MNVTYEVRWSPWHGAHIPRSYPSLDLAMQTMDVVHATGRLERITAWSEDGEVAYHLGKFPPIGAQVDPRNIRDEHNFWIGPHGDLYLSDYYHHALVIEMLQRRGEVEPSRYQHPPGWIRVTTPPGGLPGVYGPGTRLELTQRQIDTLFDLGRWSDNRRWGDHILTDILPGMQENPDEKAMNTPLILWHGAQRWEGPPELKPAGKRKSEHGSGLYLTTSAQTTRKYAKGGGAVLRVEIDPDLVWLDRSRISLEDALDFVHRLPRLKHRKEIEADLVRNATRMGAGEILAGALSNLMHYHGALTGQHGPALARFYVDCGIDADLVRQSDEDWVILFNLDKILSWRRARPDEVEDVPLLRDRRNPTEDPWETMLRETAEWDQRQAHAAALLEEALIIAIGREPDDRFFLLHPSTTIPGGWQVSMFDRRGPFGHAEGQDKGKVIRDALEDWDLRSVRPVTEREFMAISTTPQFAEGVRRVTYVGLANRIGYEFGMKALPYLDAAQSASSLDEAIDILHAGLRALRG